MFIKFERSDLMLNNARPLVSLIIPVKNEGIHIWNTIQSAFKVKTDYPFEIIVVNDGSTDGCCDFLPLYVNSNILKVVNSKGIGAARARNMGAINSLGEYLIFCDAHVFFEDFWIDGLLEPIRGGLVDSTTPGIADTILPNYIGYGQTLNEHLEIEWHVHKTTFSPIAVLPGGCFAISRKVFFNIGGFDSGFWVWGHEDVEFSIKMWLFGYTCYVQPTVKILHVFRKSPPYHVDWKHTFFNMLRMAYSHFKEERIEKCRNLIKNCDPSKIEESVLASGVLTQRKKYFDRRQYDDDWFMKKFIIPF